MSAFNSPEIAIDRPDATSATPRQKLLRLSSILAPNGPIPVSRSTWWAGVKSGRFPAPMGKLGPRITVWRSHDIERLVKFGLFAVRTNTIADTTDRQLADLLAT